MSLPKYQVHDESSQVSHTTSLIDGVAFTSNQMSIGFMLPVFRFSCLHIVSYLKRYILYKFLILF